MSILRPGSIAACALLPFVMAACGGGSGGPPTPVSPTPAPTVTAPVAPVATTPVEYTGIFASGTFTGTVTLIAEVPVTAATAGTAAVRPMAITNATGTARFSGATQSTVNLAGSYDTTSRQFSLRGGSFTVDATVEDETVSGTIATPAGTGGVSAMRSTPASPANRFCGTYRGTESGKLLIVVRGTSVSGVAAQDGEPGSIILSGSANGTRVTFTWSWSEGIGGRGSASGTINGAIVSGSWSNTDNQSGTWSGSNTGC